MSHPISIRCAGAGGAVAYVFRRGPGGFRCSLPDGILASFFYAGVRSDPMACRLALDACQTGSQALAVLRHHGGPPYRYEIVRPGETPCDTDLQALDMLSEFEAEVRRLILLLPGLEDVLDPAVAERARMLLARAHLR